MSKPVHEHRGAELAELDVDALTSHFTTFSNAMIRNRFRHGVRLRALDRCVLAVLISMGRGFRTNRDELARDFVEGRDAVGKALGRLEAAGFLRRERRNDPMTGKLRWYWSVSDKPGTYPPPSTAKAQVGTIAGKTGAGETGDGKSGSGHLS